MQEWAAPPHVARTSTIDDGREAVDGGMRAA